MRFLTTVSAELHKAATELADKQDRSLSDLVRRLLAKAVGKPELGRRPGVRRSTSEEE
jgi:predicted HicB family RNase H-like nuclease